MEFIENMRLVDSEEAGPKVGQSRDGQKNCSLRYREVANGWYTEPNWKAQNGNPY
jgi:hypothetical protein